MKTFLYLMAAGLFVAVVAVALVAVLLGLRRALQGVTAASPALRRALPLTAAALAFWLGLTGALAVAGALSFDTRPPRLLLLIPLPLLVTVLLARSAAVGRLLDALPGAGLLYLQGMRVAVELVLWLLFLAGAVPQQMTFEGRNWDVLTGLTAPVVAYFCFRRRSWPWQVAAGWNVLGLALLLNIVTIALLSAPTPFRQFWNEPANVIISQFPFVWLPLFIVPVAYTLHVLSLRQLWRRAATRAPLPRSTTAAPRA